MPVDPLAMAREPVMWTAVDGGGNCYSWREAERHRANLPTPVDSSARACTRATSSGSGAAAGAASADFSRTYRRSCAIRPSEGYTFLRSTQQDIRKIEISNSTAQEMDRVIQKYERNCVAAILLVKRHFPSLPFFGTCKTTTGLSKFRTKGVEEVLFLLRLFVDFCQNCKL